MTDGPKASIVITRVYRATVAELWDLWTTKDGFESWWGPEGFRADVRRLEGRAGGVLDYDMVADSPEMIAAMRAAGQPVSHGVESTFTEVVPRERLVLTNVIDFLPGVETYTSTIAVDFASLPDGQARMVVTLSPMHDDATTRMQEEGFTSQLSKLDRRYGREG